MGKDERTESAPSRFADRSCHVTARWTGIDQDRVSRSCPDQDRIALTAAAAAIAGLAIGSWRIEAIEGQALLGSPGEALSATCLVLEPPRRNADGWKAAVECPGGRLLVEAGGGLPEGPGPGDRVELVGELEEPPTWLALPFNLANSVLLAFIGWVASLFGGAGQVLDTGGGPATLAGGALA
ncbi:MAG: hypothetical protein ACKORA_03935, partial [Solirubrobacterales bacterium]